MDFRKRLQPLTLEWCISDSLHFFKRDPNPNLVNTSRPNPQTA